MLITVAYSPLLCLNFKAIIIFPESKSQSILCKGFEKNDVDCLDML